SPRPVNSATELTFKDLKGKKITITLDKTEHILQTPAEDDPPEESSQTGQEQKKTQRLVIKKVEKVLFTTLSPSAIMIKIWFQPINNKNTNVAESIFYVRLKNANATL
ncbi:MAG TPA: hypothetical protein PKK26_19935, partial [Candidatus Wallbacteria bacterium]|nr:hypothetical protein [Candidatus Wallbacteria bacterium]